MLQSMKRIGFGRYLLDPDSATQGSDGNSWNNTLKSYFVEERKGVDGKLAFFNGKVISLRLDRKTSLGLGEGQVCEWKMDVVKREQTGNDD